VAPDRKRVTIFGTELNDKQRESFGWGSFYLLITIVNAWSAGSSLRSSDWGNAVFAGVIAVWFLSLANQQRDEIETIESRKNKRGRDA
jgi:hypothetical protein